MNGDRIPLDRVFDDMERGGVVGYAAETYYHTEYLGEERVENCDKKWWQFWKPSEVWRKVKKTVVFDFDGVIHSYTSGWKGETNIPDPPVDGIQEALKKIHDNGYEIVIVSTRCKTAAGRMAIENWLDMYGMTQDVDRVCKEKPPAIVYIDDRAICFDGNSKDLLRKIKNFKTWQSEV